MARVQNGARFQRENVRAHRAHLCATFARTPRKCNAPSYARTIALSRRPRVKTATGWHARPWRTQLAYHDARGTRWRKGSIRLTSYSTWNESHPAAQAESTILTRAKASAASRLRDIP